VVINWKTCLSCEGQIYKLLVLFSNKQWKQVDFFITDPKANWCFPFTTIMNKKILRMHYLIVAVNDLVEMFDFIFGWLTASFGCFVWLSSVCPGKCFESILKISGVCFHPYSSQLTLCNCPISHSTQYHLCR